jgi:DNA (cytosine-5)-methyltransferase 1
MKTIRTADLFCGAGGTSLGILGACEALGRRVDMVAINHNPLAVETHAANHPRVKHLCENLNNTDPKRAVPGGRLDLLVASPECTHHSIARGGKPVSDQSRASAWCILRWLTALKVERVLIENVREFVSWGPIGSNGRPLRRQRGKTFEAFIAALRSLGYRVDWRLLNAADYGDPTTRERLFIQAVRGRRPIRWPEPTHSRDGRSNLFGHGCARWAAARSVIDWQLLGRSIFGRRHPLSENTLKRIEAGLRRFGGAAAEPFLILLRGTAHSPKSVDLPVPTLTAGGNHVGLVRPFLLHTTHAGGDRVHDVDRPVPAVTGAHRGEQALVAPFLMGMSQTGSNGDRLRPIDEPLPTVTTADDLAVCAPFILPHRQFDGMQVDDVDEPMRTVTAHNGGNNALVTPFIVAHHGERPGQVPRVHSVDCPTPALGCSKTLSLIQPFLVPCNGAPSAMSEPAPTVTCRDRLALVQPRQQLDILFRMLQPHELAGAMSFPRDYVFKGTREQKVKQIGNAVPRQIATALCRALLEDC